MDKVSVIIPIYNAESSISNCLESILNQTYSNIEIVLVNDGSTDNSASICEKYTKENEIIIYYYQENQGQQQATQQGLELSSGKYVLFVDADDWIENNMIEILVKDIDNCDLATSGCIMENEIGDVIAKRHDLIEEGKYIGGERYDYVINNFMIYKHKKTKGLLNNKCCKLFLKEKAIEAMHMANINISIEEDFLFVLSYLMLSSSICISHYCYYHYVQNGNSMTHCHFEKYLSERERVFDRVMQLLNQNGYDRLISSYQTRFFYDLVSSMPIYMQLSNNKICMMSYFPSNLKYLMNKNLIIYGFGKRGRAFYEWLKLICPNTKVITIVDNGLVGEMVDGFIIQPQDCIQNFKEEVIVITIAATNMRQRILNEIEYMGITEDRIVFLETMSLMDVIL